MERLAQMAKYRKSWKNKRVRILTLLLLFSLPSLAALSLGDGSDGICAWTSTQTLSKNSWNCQSISVSPGAVIDFAGPNNVVLRSRGEVTIDGTIDVSADGQNGGPGGGDGGASSTQNGSGFQSGEGLGGSSDLGATGAGGGGGGHDGPGQDGTTNSGASFGVGGQPYGSESNFQNTIYGGSGGGAGGDGNDGLGGVGGGGGGSLTIISKGQVLISGQILANGANGSAPTGSFGGGGAGGSGSGGAIYIISQVSLTVSGTLDVPGGVSVSGGGPGGGNGGAGAIGRVRLDAPTGALDTSGANIPADEFKSTPPTIFDPLAMPRSFESDISYACSYKEIKRPEDLLLQAVIGFSFIFLIISIGRILLGLRYRQY